MANFRIYNESLCPDLWDKNMHLDPEIRINLLRTAYDFYRKTKLPAPIKDVYLMGSIANYNWTADSDVDVHVMVDYNQMQMPPETAFKTVKTAGATWNEEHNIIIKGHKVEMNIQNTAEEKPYVTGVYSLVKDQWVRKPYYQYPKIDKVAVMTKYEAMRKYIEGVVKSGDREQMKNAKKYLDAFRQYGLDNFGELSYENIVYKILRAKGIIKWLKDSITAVYDQEMTIAEGQDWDYQAAEDFLRRKDEQLLDLANLLKQSKGQGHVPWNKVPAARLKKIWLDYGRSGVVRDEKGLENIADRILTNIARLAASTEMMGHSQVDARAELEDTYGIEFTDEEWDKWMSDYFTNEYGSWMLSDYGLVPLEQLYGKIYKAETAEEKLHFIDRALNIVHQRSDLAAMFIEGGSATLNAIFSQGGYSSQGDEDPKHGKNFGKLTDVDEVGMKDLKARHPHPFMPQKLGKDPLGPMEPDFSKMTLDNIKALRDKASREYQYAKQRGDTGGIERSLAKYRAMHDELRRRLDYINKPVTEARVKWINQSEGENEMMPFYKSEDGRFEIVPQYIGRVRPQFFYVVDKATNKKYHQSTLAMAKEKVESILNPAPPPVPPTQEKMQAAYNKAISDGYMEFAAEIAKNANKMGFTLQTKSPLNEGQDVVSTKGPEELTDAEIAEVNRISSFNESGISILSDKELSIVYMVGDKVAGALYTSFIGGTFSFDAIVGKEFRNQFLGARIIREGLRQYFQEILDMDSEAKLELDVVNSRLIKPLQAMGLVIDRQIGDHVLMTFPTKEVDEGYGAGNPEDDPKAVGRWTVKFDSSSKILK